jgi:hypothetical protein
MYFVNDPNELQQETSEQLQVNDKLLEGANMKGVIPNIEGGP